MRVLQTGAYTNLHCKLSRTHSERLALGYGSSSPRIFKKQTEKHTDNSVAGKLSLSSVNKKKTTGMLVYRVKREQK